MQRFASPFLALGLAVLAVFVDTSLVNAQSCPANVPHIDGVWKTLPYLMPVNPISATLLSNGQILIVSGSEYDPNNSSSGTDWTSKSYRTAVWYPTDTTEYIQVLNTTYDVFCAGTSVLPDGRPLIVGGTKTYATQTYGWTGEDGASLFNPQSRLTPQVQDMADGRWYATVTTLGDGRAATFSGYGYSGATNNTVEIYDLAYAGVGWTIPVAAPFIPPLFPRMELLPNGTVFYNGQGSGGGGAPYITPNGWILNPTTQSWTQSAAITTWRSGGSAVLLPLLPPNYVPKVMNFGGNSPAYSSTEIIDLSATSPKWTAGPNMSAERVLFNAVLLPNGKVLTEGGSSTYNVPDAAGKHADLYDSNSNTFGSGGTAAYSRLYHSTALLLPDARVVSLGSNPGNRGRYEPSIEIYSPPYLYNANDQLIGNRPVITSTAPGVLAYNSGFTINYTSSAGIGSAVLMRPGSVTHFFDMDQRMVGLCGPAPQPACAPGAGTLTLMTPPNGNIAPPGYYMLFLLDNNGVPSKAQFIQLSLHPGTPPSATITSPTSSVTIVVGNSVNFSAASTPFQYSWVFPGGSPPTSVAQNPGNVVFNTPGIYLTSLTAIDSLGNTDPNPPTLQVTVLPKTTDFQVSVTPPAVQVVPGQSAIFTVAISPRRGFNGPVSLTVGSVVGFPMGVSSGGFSPAQLNVSSTSTSTLTMNTTTAAAPFALSLTVTGTSGSFKHTASTTLLISLAPPSGLNATASASQVSLAWTATTGASGYNIKRSQFAGGPYTSIGCATTNSFADTNVVKGITYHYVVAADFTGGQNGGGESTDSSEASAALN
jgi:hypothetical protein